MMSENFTTNGPGTATTGAQVGYKRSAYMGSCRHDLWQAIRASSAAPYYLDDYSDGISSLSFFRTAFRSFSENQVAILQYDLYAF